MVTLPIESTVSVLRSGERIAAVLSRWDEAPGDGECVKLSISIEGIEISAKSDIGYFRALKQLREILEKKGILVECLGASEDVYPSPMIESMGCGERAYRLTLGQHALMSEKKKKKNSGIGVKPATIQQQEDFYKRWLQSL